MKPTKEVKKALDDYRKKHNLKKCGQYYLVPGEIEHIAQHIWNTATKQALKGWKELPKDALARALGKEVKKAHIQTAKEIFEELESKDGGYFIWGVERTPLSKLKKKYGVK